MPFYNFYSKDNSNSFTNINFASGVWTNEDFDRYIKELTQDADGNDVYPIRLTFDDPTFRVIINLADDYQLDLTKSKLYATNQITFSHIKLRSLTCHFFVNNLNFITYSNRFIQPH